MAHDRNGTPLKAGDRVTVELIVRSISPNVDACNVTLATPEPLPPGGVSNCFTINTKQTLLHTAAPAPQPTSPQADAGYTKG